MRLLLAAALAVIAAPVAAQDIPPHDKAEAHPPRLFHMVRAEADYGRADEEAAASWEADAWFGGDRHKLWLKSEGEGEDGELEHARIEALWSRNVATFWDLQLGVRHDFEPDSDHLPRRRRAGARPLPVRDRGLRLPRGRRRAQRAAVPVSGRSSDPAPYPRARGRAGAHAGDAPERGVGAGFSGAEVSARLRYEITRKFAPYVELAWESRLGETADLARAEGDDVETTSSARRPARLVLKE